jgi:hypothetical protein
MDNTLEKQAMEMYCTLGRANNNGSHPYKQMKEQFLNGSMFKARGQKPRLITPMTVKGYVQSVAQAMLSGFKTATKTITKDG